MDAASIDECLGNNPANQFFEVYSPNAFPFKSLSQKYHHMT